MDIAIFGKQTYVETDVFIRISGGVTNTPSNTVALSFLIENRYFIEPVPSENGTFRSAKHGGNGIGIASVRSIAEKYDGSCSFLYKNKIFTVSVLLNDRSEQN